MKILLITYLYPGYVSQSRKEVSFAIHYFARKWVHKGIDVKVARIWNYYPKVFKLSKVGKNANKHASKENFEIEGVKITRFPFKKMPLIGYSIKKKHQLAKEIIDEFGYKFKPDIVISHMINSSLFIAYEVSKALKIPLILTIHGSDLRRLKNKSNDYMDIEPYISKIGFRSPTLMTEYNKRINKNRQENDLFLVMSGIDGEQVISFEDLKKN